MRGVDPFAPFCITRRAQLITKSDQWFRDTGFLYKAARYAATLYIGGFVIECLLKASLWDRRFEPKVRVLIYSHDLQKLLAANGKLSQKLRSDTAHRHQQFVRLSTWNVRFRYNPTPVRKQDAEDFVRRLSEVRSWLLREI